MSNIPGYAWMDEDGKHVWFSHKCVEGEIKTMLPYPRWQNINGMVHPSVVCGVVGCGFHSFPIIGERRPA